MQSRKAGVAVAVGALALAIVLFVALRDDGGGASDRPATQTATSPGEGAPPEPAAVPTITVRDGEPVGGVRELEFTRGEVIRFIVRSDVADEVHLHGYDVAREVPAGGRVRFDVPAEIEGTFEVELEERGVPIAEISVRPA